MFGEHKGSFTAVLSDEISVLKAPFDLALFRHIEELQLSMDTEYCLRNSSIVYLGDLVQQTDGALLRSSNFGRKSLNEIKGVLEGLGLHLGTELPGWPPENIESIVKDIHEHHERVELLKTEIHTICQSLNDPWRSDDRLRLILFLWRSVRVFSPSSRRLEFWPLADTGMLQSRLPGCRFNRLGLMRLCPSARSKRSALAPTSCGCRRPARAGLIAPAATSD